MRDIVERLFGALTTQRLQRGAYRSTEALEAASHVFLDYHNQNPKPLVWTKSADEILESVTRFCHRISASRHYARSRSSSSASLLNSLLRSMARRANTLCQLCGGER